MKINNTLSVFAGFVSGIALGITLLILSGFHSAGPSGAIGTVNPINVPDANACFKRYFGTAVPLNEVIKGFTIDKAQLEAMNNIAKENAALEAFRIYKGVDNNNRQVAIVVGVDLAGKDALKNTVYSTVSRSCGPCPPLCDKDSPIAVP